MTEEDREFQIKASEIKFSEEPPLGRGGFGEVRKAYYNGNLVAFKKLVEVCGELPKRSAHLFILLFIHSPTSLSTLPSIHLSVHPSVHLSVPPSSHLSIHSSPIQNLPITLLQSTSPSIHPLLHTTNNASVLCTDT